MPKITVVIPVFKTEAFIQECLESVLNQSLKDIEIIAVNDGSPDDAGKICDEYAKKDNRIKVIHQKNMGGCVAMKKGVHLAKGEYVMFLDGDDWLNLDTCSLAYKAAKEHGADIIFWSFIKEYPNKSLKSSSVFSSDMIFRGRELLWLQRRLIGLVGEELKQPTTTDTMSSGWGKLFKRELIQNDEESIIDRNGNHNFDSLINIRLFSRAKVAVYLHQFFNHYRQFNPNSATKTHKLNLAGKYLIMFENIQLFINENELDGEFQIALNNRIALSLINNSLNVTSPRQIGSFEEKIKHLGEILHHKTYHSALSDLKTKFLPLHWKIFFLFCKWKFSYGVYFLALIMQKLR